MAVDLGRLEQVVSHPLELLGAEKEIVAAGLLAGPRLRVVAETDTSGAGRAARAAAAPACSCPTPTDRKSRSTGPAGLPNPSSLSFDILDQLANLFQKRLDLDHRRLISTSLALEPIVLISRPISWTTNSSFRPSSRLVDDFAGYWLRWARSRTISSDDIAAIGQDRDLADQVLGLDGHALVCTRAETRSVSRFW